MPIIGEPPLCAQSCHRESVIRVSICMLSLVFVAGVLEAQVPYSAFGSTTDMAGGYLVRSPIPLDWPTVARQGRPDFDPSNPDTSLIRRFYEDVIETSLIPFEVPLPASFPRAHYWVLGDSGAMQAEPRGLHGSISVQIDSATGRIVDVAYGGGLLVTARAGRSVGTPYFSFSSEVPFTFRSAQAEAVQGSVPPRVRAVFESRRYDVTFDSTFGGQFAAHLHARRDMVSARARVFGIVETGQVFLAVRWSKDDCEGAASLYDITTGNPRYVIENYGNCGE